MPFPVAAAVTAGAGLLGAGGQAVATGKMNKKSRFHALRMYEREKADNIELWNMQNQYNSPVEQMKRLKEAGLNPHLIYGSGGATTTADSIHNGKIADWRPETPNIQAFGSAIQDSLKTYYDVRQADLQAEQMKKNATISQQKINDNVLDVGLKIAKTKALRQSTHQAEAMENSLVNTAYENLRKAQLETSYSVNEEERRRIAASQNTKQAAMNILLGRKAMAKDDAQIRYYDQQIKNLEMDRELDKYDLNNQKQGLSVDADYVTKYIGTKYPEWLPTYMAADKGLEITKDLGNIVKGFGMGTKKAPVYNKTIKKEYNTFH